MTIVTSVKVRDGLVLGTDSMTQLAGLSPEGQIVFVKSYTNARKLFQLAPRAAVMTFGMGNIGDHSIEGLVREFRQELVAESSIEATASALFEFIEPRWRAVVGDDPHPHMHVLGFCVEGYSPGASFAEVYEFNLPRDEAPFRVSGEEDFGLLWRGIDLPLIRLIKGWDPRLIDSFAQAGIQPEQAQAMIAPLELFLSQPGMPIQDAVNLIEYLLNTTIGLSTFVDTNPTCGGPLQVAAILPDRGFAWISEPEISLHRQEHTS